VRETSERRRSSRSCNFQNTFSPYCLWNECIGWNICRRNDSRNVSESISARH